MDSYSTAELARRAGVSYRQLDYWARNGLVTPSILDTHGHGHPRRWAPGDLERVRQIAKVAAVRTGRLADLVTS